MQEAMHALSLLAPKTADVAASLEQNTRRLDAYIKVSGAQALCAQSAWRMDRFCSVDACCRLSS